jgi:hypothetical protein
MGECMKSQHIFRIESTLLQIDKNLADYEIRIERDSLQNEKTKQTIKEIKEIRHDVKEFLKSIGVEEEENDIYSDLKLSCTIIEHVDLVELEPKRLQEGYGKFDYPEEEFKLSPFIKNLKTKIRKLGKISVKDNKKENGFANR